MGHYPRAVKHSRCTEGFPNTSEKAFLVVKWFQVCFSWHVMGPLDMLHREEGQTPLLPTCTSACLGKHKESKMQENGHKRRRSFAFNNGIWACWTKSLLAGLQSKKTHVQNQACIWIVFKFFGLIKKKKLCFSQRCHGFPVFGPSAVPDGLDDSLLFRGCGCATKCNRVNWMHLVTGPGLWCSALYDSVLSITF